MAEAQRKAEAVCAAVGARFTETRRQVFGIIWQSHKALTAADIMEKLGNSQPPITYRALDFLEKLGLVHHVASLNAYVGCTHPEEPGHVGQLLICKHCRNVTEVEGVEDPLQKAAHKAGFNIEHVHVEVLGVCRDCRAKGVVA
jgi:Fur family zinc uptake transcriptional regulator